MTEDRASETALLVQQGLVFCATRASTAHLVSPESRDASIRILNRLEEGRSRLRSLDGLSRFQISVMERMMLPGITLHYALRKRWFEEQVRAAIHSGARQFINLGAGLDTLAIRLASERDDLRLIEVDHPASQGAKGRALNGEAFADRVELLPVDFTKQTLRERLPQASTFDPTLPTVLLCEGVIAYLDEADTKELFSSIRDLLPRDTVVLFTFIAKESPTGLKPLGPLLHVFLRWQGESAQMRIEPEEMKALLKTCGFDLEETALGPDILAQYGPRTYQGPVHDLEIMARARQPPA